MATLALTMSACGEDDPPPTEPTSAATTPANPDATLPPMPAAAQEFTPNGAATFVRYYVSVLSFASATGDVEELESLSDPECGGCSDYIDYFRQTYLDGGWIQDRAWSNGGTKLWFDDAVDGETRATTNVTLSAGSLKKDGDSEPSAAPKSSHPVTFGLTFDGSAWSMTQLVAGDPK
ncbi:MULTISPECIES: DUF6318 family protein [Aeromicrobium]|uniref:DUF6318 family protein n=1 Tax=Aeromicrobium TaxID=2040 RepID=UPI00257F5137|nr:MULTISPECIES: DUF6318 family protein [Aeromicrobium]